MLTDSRTSRAAALATDRGEAAEPEPEPEPEPYREPEPGGRSLVVSNPPWGMRLDGEASVAAWRGLGRFLPNPHPNPNPNPNPNP